MAHLAALSTSNADASHIDVGFVRFLKRIHKMPMLSSDEELNLTRHYAQFKDPASAQKIVNSHLKLVSRIAVSYSGYGLSLNMPLAEGENDEWQDLILDDAENHEERFVEREAAVHKQQLLRQGMSKLNDREREIFIARRLQSRAQTLDELSQIHHISKERVRQIDNQAFNKVQHFMLQKAKSDKLVL